MAKRGRPPKKPEPIGIAPSLSELRLAPDEGTQLTGVRQKVFLDRYSLKDEHGKPTEMVPEKMWERVAKGLASVERTEAKQREWTQKFYEAMSGFKFVPGGRILSGAGTPYQVTFYNCFVIPSPHDSRGGIIDNLKIMVEIMSRSGGVGINLSSLRPRGARVVKVNGTASGPVNWAELYSVATHDVIQQGGCFAAETRIMTHQGLLPIRDIVQSKHPYYASTHQGYKKITTKFDNGQQSIFEVTTAAGLTVKTTAEHKFLTFDYNGHFSLRALRDLHTEDNIVHLLGQWRDDIPPVLLNTNLPSPSKYSYGLKNLRLPPTLDENLAFLIGAYDADGSKIPDEHSPNGKGIRIAVADNRTHDIQRLITTIKRCFNITPKLRKGDGAVTIIQVFSRRLNEFLALNDLLKESSIRVSVPEHIFSSPRHVVEAYIAGVFLGDGSNRGGKGGLRITTVSQPFARELQLLLFNLGIAAKIKTQNRKDENWKTIYTVTINGARFMQRFLQILAPYTEKVHDHPISRRDGFFNWPFNLVERFLYVPHFQRTMARSNPTTSQKSALFLQQATPIIREHDRPDVEFLANCVPDKIVSIKPIGQQNVYDLEVEDTHLLSGNGFYTSNSRRGALMLMLDDWHPDIEEFIEIKKDLSRINGANLSICVSDPFMEAVKKNGDWNLIYPDIKHPKYDEEWDGNMRAWKQKGYPVKVYKTIKAAELWDMICKAAWASAEPGLHFIDRSNKRSNTFYYETLISTNPCGEQPLGAWSVCNLGAINLSAFVENGIFDYNKLIETTKIAVRALDNVVDANYYFFEENETNQKGTRRTGLGTMGLGDALIKMKIRYGSQEAGATVEKIYRTIRDAAYESSIEIAAEKGPFPKFEKEKYLKGDFIQKLPRELREGIARHGIRNAVILTQAPTGTTSLLSGVSSGIEPVYDFAFVRRDRTGEHTIYHPLYKKWKGEHPGEPIPDYFVAANDLTPEDHVRIQAIIQDYTDSSISKTVNAPNSHSVEDVKKLYTLAYDLGLKGITYMRDGSRAGVLSHIEEKPKQQEAETQQVKNVPTIQKEPTPTEAWGLRLKKRSDVGNVYTSIYHNADGKPVEIFVTVGKSGGYVAGAAEATGRLASLALKYGANPQEVADELIGITCGTPMGIGPNAVLSMFDAVGKSLADLTHDKQMSLTEESTVTQGNGELLQPGGDGQIPVTQTTQQSSVPPTKSTRSPNGPAALKKMASTAQYITPMHGQHATFGTCPDCGSPLIAQEGCTLCINPTCGYSTCG